MSKDLKRTSSMAKETANTAGSSSKSFYSSHPAPRAWVVAVADTFLDLDLISVLNSGLYNSLARVTQPRESRSSFGGFVALLACVSSALVGTTTFHVFCQFLIEHLFPNLILGTDEAPPADDFILKKYSPTSDVLFWFVLLGLSTMLLASGWCVLLVTNSMHWRILTAVVLLTSMASVNLFYHRVVDFLKLPHLILSGIQNSDRAALAWWGWTSMVVCGSLACFFTGVLRVKDLRGDKSGSGTFAALLLLFLTSTVLSAAALGCFYVLDYYESFQPQLFKKMDAAFLQRIAGMILLLVILGVWFFLNLVRLFMRRPIDAKDAGLVRDILKNAGFEEPELSKEMSWRTVVQRDGHVVGLTLQRCRNLKSLSGKIGELSKLRRLNLDDCHNLVFLPPQIGKLPDLKKITLSGCDQLQIPKQDIVQSADDERIIDFMKRVYAFHEGRFSEIVHLLSEEEEAELIHAVVLNRDYAKALESVVRANKSLPDVKDKTGRTAKSHAVEECKNAIASALAFKGRYELEKPPSYESRKTCKVFFAKDYGDLDDEQKPRPVVLKFMYIEKDFRSEIQARRDSEGRARFLDDYTFTDSRFYDGSNEGDTESIVFRDAVDSEPDLIDEGVKPMYCLVMKQGGRNLEERIRAVFSRPDRVRDILRQLAQCLRHIHDRGYVHGDFKPKNIVWDGHSHTWKLIDFNATVEKSTELKWEAKARRWMLDSDEEEMETQPNLGWKTSTAYAPPEMITRRPGRSPEVRPSCVRCPAGWWCEKAHESYDAWSFGVVMFQLLVGSPLFPQADEKHDNLNASGLEKLVNWDTKALTNELNAISGISQVAKELLEQLLDPDPRKRPSMEKVLMDSGYFNLDRKLEDIEQQLSKAREAGESTAQLQKVKDEILDDLKEVKRLVSGNNTRLVHLAHEISDMRRELAVFQELTGRMFGEIIEAKSVPKYVFVVPVQCDTGWQKARKWGQIKNWFSIEVKIYFVCPVTLRVADGKEKKVRFQRDWVQKYGPALVLSLRVLSVACGVGRLAGLPLPSLGDVVDQVKDRIGEHADVLTQLLEGLGREKELSEVFAWAEKKFDEYANVEDSGPAPKDVPENLRLSYNEIQELYQDDPDFASSGLKKTLCKSDGTVEFVLPEVAELYKEMGAECVGLPERELELKRLRVHSE